MNNRTAGHNSERKWVDVLSTHFSLIKYVPKNKNIHIAQVGSTRLFSTALDAMKIDIWISPSLRYLSKLYMQIKKKVIRGNSRMIDVTALEEMHIPDSNDGFKILVTHLKHKPGKNEMELGWYVTMPAEDWLKLIKEWKDGREISD